MEASDPDRPRWLYRFENYSRAFQRLRKAVELLEERDLTALDARNKMAHTYNLEAFEAVVAGIRGRYFGLLDDLHMMLLEKQASSGGL